MGSEYILGLRLWAVLLAACGVAALLFLLAGFTLEFGLLNIFVGGPLIGIVATRLLRRYPATYAFAGAVEGIFMMSFAALFGCLTCYAAAAGHAPLADAALLRIDRLLGYDWEAYAHFCTTHPMLLPVLRFAYGTIATQPVLIGTILLIAKQEVRFEKYVLANLVAEAMTAILFLLWPATTAWTFEGKEALAASILPDLPVHNNSWLYDLLQIRDGTGHHLTRLAGIVAFPSFHCAAALLNLWSLWSVRAARLPFLGLNLIMIAATPLMGGHYVTDLIGGALVSVMAILAAHELHRWFRAARWPSLPPLRGRWLSPRPAPLPH